jgi:threonine/homoserine/homoserine lactone efflux protein
MFDLAHYLLFVGASLLLLVTPGPAVLFVVARAIDHGRWAGVVSSLGLAIGTLVHLFAVVLGLSAILMTSAALYTGIKYAGAAYLIVLGIRRLLTRDEPKASRDNAPLASRKLLLEGIIVNILNPKSALFFLAFLPQFADPARGQLSLQLAVLGLSFIVLGLITDTLYALLAGTAGGWLRRRTAFSAMQRYVTGSVYIALGVLTILSGQTHRVPDADAVVP